MDDKKEKQNHKVTLFAILLSIISLGVLVFGFTVVSSDKVVMLQSLSNLYNKIDTVFFDDLVLFDKISSTDKVGINAKNTLTVGNDKYNLNLNYVENYNDKLSKLDFLVSHNEDNLNTSLVFDKDNRYFSIKNVTDGYYYYDEDEYVYRYIFKCLNSNDYEKLLALLKEVINNQIDNNKIKKEKVIINYNGKDKKVSKLTYDIDYKELDIIITNFISSVSKDKSLYKNISNILVGEKDLKDFLNNYLNRLKEVDGNILSYSTYYYGFNKIVQYEFNYYSDNLTLNYKDDNNRENILLTQGENILLNIDIDKSTKDKKISFSGNISPLIEKIKLPIDGIYKKILASDFSGNYKDKNLELSIAADNPIKIKFNFNNSVLDGVYKYNTNLDVYNIINEEEKESFKIESEIEFVFDKKIDVDVIDATLITVDSMEQKQIDDLLNQNPIYQTYSEYINPILPNYGND